MMVVLENGVILLNRERAGCVSLWYITFRVSSPAILMSILGPIPTGIMIIPVGIAN